VSTSPTTARPFRWLLLGSMGLNVALIATMIMLLSGWHQPHHGGGRERADLPSPRLLLAALSEDRQSELKEVYGQHRKTVRAAMRERRRARRAVREQMLAAEFEPERIDQAFAELRLKDEQAAAAVQLALKEMLGQLTAAERAKVVELVPKHRRRHRDKNHRHERPETAAEAPVEAESTD